MPSPGRVMRLSPFEIARTRIGDSFVREGVLITCEEFSWRYLAKAAERDERPSWCWRRVGSCDATVCRRGGGPQCARCDSSGGSPEHAPPWATSSIQSA